MIKSILKHPFCKVVLDYLVVDNELVIEPNKVKLKVDKIMEDVKELSLVVDNLPNDKAAGLSGISNQLWKHYVIENTLEKNRELWLVLQDMRKAYNSVGWYHLQASLHCIKMCEPIPINQRVRDALLLINGSPILIAKKTYKNVRFFSNVVLRKAITDKQFCYLVLAVLQPIVSYHMQFSFVTLDMCHKWDIMVRKDLRAKAGLLCDFPNEILYHLSLYDLKPFEQVQSEGKLASLILFSNISPVNNFLVGMVKIFLMNELSLANNLPCAFRGSGDFLLSGILGLVSYWFSLMSDFMNNAVSLRVSATTAAKREVLSVLDSDSFSEIRDSLLKVWSDCIEVSTDGSLKYAGSVEVTNEVAAYFSATNADIGVKDKNISIEWVKVKEHSDVLGNIKANALANETTFSSFFLPVNIRERFLVAEKTVISDNVCHFAQDLYWSVCRAYWEAGLGFDIVLNVLIKEIDWNAIVTVWHPDLHMLSKFTSRKSANLCMYLMKAVYKRLLVAVRKRLYDQSYPGVLCLLCGEVEFSDHVFTCSCDSDFCRDILVNAAEK
ncbi:hypothetical protein G9A89_007632 [Geosiphon pyriformis]|nr:hypothetical protein G9A89_007632 [Geosiphon pyriformis]